MVPLPVQRVRQVLGAHVAVVERGDFRRGRQLQTLYRLAGGEVYGRESQRPYLEAEYI